MKKIQTIIRISLLILIIGLSSCTSVNEPLDASTNRMFRPLSLIISGATSTLATASWPAVPGAERYVVETSQDSLTFATIFVSDTIPADTISTFRYEVSGLTAATGYSVRVCVLPKDKSIPKSMYREVYFVTPAN